MSEIMKDIKLFGKTITLFPDKVVSDDSVSEHRYCSFTASTSDDSKDEYSLTRSGHEYESIDPTEDVQTSIDMDDDTESPTKEESGENNQEKTLKKPDKVLPCPRCASMDTKFCYYNNYNVKQPRHFCKNCQRYWTSGGTMRNVPVGSGRRKNKNTALPSFHHIMVSDTLQSGFIIGHSSGFPVSFYPAAGTAYWNVPIVSPAGGLGKHSREGKLVGTSKDSEDVERSVLIPKTLRIDDPNEAAKSSIWSTLGMKQAKNGGGVFRAFESKGDRIIDNTAMVLQANPAALSRSLNFHERA